MPWRSGSPHGVLGGVQSSPSPVPAVRVPGIHDNPPCAARIDTAMTTMATTPSDTPSLRLITTPPLAGGLLGKASVDQLFDKGLTLEFHQLNIALHPAIEREADLPGPRKDLRIVDGRLVPQVVRAHGRQAFDDVRGVAVKVAGAIEPVIAVQPGDIDDERVALPRATRPPHEERVIYRSLLRPVHANKARRAVEFVGDEDRLG